MSDEQIGGGWKLDQREGTRRALKYPDGPGKIIIVNHDGRGWWDPRAFCKALRGVASVQAPGMRPRPQRGLATGDCEHMVDGPVGVTNTAQIRTEQAVLDRARVSADDRSEALSTETLRAPIARSVVPFTAKQRAAVHALGQSGRLTMLTEAAGVGKTTLLQPVVAAWHADGRFASVIGRQVVGKAMAWRHADALQEAGVHHTYAMLLGGDRGQVINQIADLYIARRDVLTSSGSKQGITVSAPTNDDVADPSGDLG